VGGVQSGCMGKTTKRMQGRAVRMQMHPCIAGYARFKGRKKST
jgi:hypothetical protein